MRLTPQQINHIIDALTPFIQHEHAELRLYGSRVHDERKGGDIDLLLLLDNNRLTDELCEKKHYILAAIKQLLGDQKIDLTIRDKHKVHDDYFLKLITPASIVLKLW